MSLGYRIVWVDDTPSWVDSVIDEVVEHVKKSGYEPAIERLEDGAELAQKCTDPDLDLVIIDYRLPGTTGDRLISQLRDVGNFTEIVFYSNQWPSEKPGLLLDGVFRCERTDAKDKIKDVIDLTLHKLKDLGVVRGLVIASAIDLEIKIEQIMVSVFGEKGDVFREQVLDKQRFDFASKAMFLQRFVKDRINECNIQGKKVLLETASTTMKKFIDEVVEPRNILAHSKRIVKGGKTVLESVNSRANTSVTFDREWLKDMRGDLRKHQKNLDTIDELLKDTA